jgi:hypothetical protein
VSDEFSVRPDELRAVSAECEQVSEAISRDVVAEHLAPAADLVTGSLLAAAMGAADGRVAVALAGIASELGHYAENVSAAAAGYEETDDAFARSLQVFDE